MDKISKNYESDFSEEALSKEVGIDLDTEPSNCFSCEENIAGSDFFRVYRVCPYCRFHFSITARRYLALLVDKGSFEEIGGWVTPEEDTKDDEDDLKAYLKNIASERDRTGLNEAVVTGVAKVGGVESVVVALNFGFYGGSMGMVVGEKIAFGLDYATNKNLPCVAVITSGGSRTDEGVVSTYQMAKTLSAIAKFKGAKKPLITVLGNPTSGLVMGSFVTQSDVIFAEPKARIGLSDMQSLINSVEEKTKDLVHNSEQMSLYGQIDRVVDRENLRYDVLVTLDILTRRAKIKKSSYAYAAKQQQSYDKKQLLAIASAPDRPTSKDYIAKFTTDWIELKGDRVSGDDQSLRCGLAKIDGIPALFVAQQRDKQREVAIGASGFRKAKRLIDLASRLNLPVITIIDGLDYMVSLDEEHKGISKALSDLILTMTTSPAATIAVIIGVAQGMGGMGFSIANRVLMLSRSVVLLDGSNEHSHIVTSSECLKLNIVDEVLDESVGDLTLNTDTLALLKNAIVANLTELQNKNPNKVASVRQKRYRGVGEMGPLVKGGLAREFSAAKTFASVWGKSITNATKDKGELKK